MRGRALALFAMSLVVVNSGLAKKKAKQTMPPYVLSARTVAVIIDPEAGVSIDDPLANQTAQKDVETALANWGRFEPQLSTQNADLIIVVRRGNGRLAQQTIHDPRQNSRPGSVTPSDDSLSIGAQHGQQPNAPVESNSDAAGDPIHTQTEIGNTEDSFVVYEGGQGDVLNESPAWRYVVKDGLEPHSVPAVEAFRKAVAEADKAAASAKP
jgi:hypothetical protein